MGVSDFLQRLQAMPAGSMLEWNRIRDEFSSEYEQATTEERVTLLEIYKVVMDHVERHLSSGDLETFRELRRQDYNRLLISECVTGEGDVSPEAIRAVTDREVAAGRMAADDRLRQIAVGGLDAFRPEKRARWGWRKLLGRRSIGE